MDPLSVSNPNLPGSGRRKALLPSSSLSSVGCQRSGTFQMTSSRSSVDKRNSWMISQELVVYEDFLIAVDKMPHTSRSSKGVFLKIKLPRKCNSWPGSGFCASLLVANHVIEPTSQSIPEFCDLAGNKSRLIYLIVLKAIISVISRFLSKQNDFLSFFSISDRGRRTNDFGLFYQDSSKKKWRLSPFENSP